MLDLQQLRAWPVAGAVGFQRLGGGIAAQQLDEGGTAEQADDGGADGRILPVAVKVEIEDILPGPVAARAAFQLGQVDVAVGKLAQRVDRANRACWARQRPAMSCAGQRAAASPRPTTKKRV